MDDAGRDYIDYVSPFDELVRQPEPLAQRPTTVAGRTVALLDITKNRSAEFIDRIESQLKQAGAVTFRSAKEIFSKPAVPTLIDDIAGRADLAVEALAD